MFTSLSLRANVSEFVRATSLKSSRERRSGAAAVPVAGAVSQKFALTSLLLLAACLLLSANVRAASITVVNPSFEADILADGAFQYTVSGWTVTAGGVWNPTIGEFAGGAPDGLNAAFLGAQNLGQTTGILKQTTGATFQNGLTYELTVEVGDRSDLSLPTFRIGLWADNVLVSAGGLVVSNTDPRLPGDGQFSTIDASVTADSSIHGKSIEIRFEAFLADAPLIIDGSSLVKQISFDSVELNSMPSQVVPLPSAIYLFGSVLGLLGWLRRRPARLA